MCLDVPKEILRELVFGLWTTEPPIWQPGASRRPKSASNQEKSPSHVAWFCRPQRCRAHIDNGDPGGLVRHKLLDDEGQPKPPWWFHASITFAFEALSKAQGEDAVRC